MKLLYMIRPLASFLPVVEKPTRRIILGEKIQYSFFCLLLYCVCSNLPLFGMERTVPQNDPFYWMRVILASNRGTLMELGVTPLISAGMILQLLAGSRVIEFNQNIKEDRILFEAAQKISGILMTIVTAAAYVFSGMYGPVSAIGYGNALLIVAQLSAAGVMLLLLDELLQKGYGFGSGINLFIAAHICETVLWSAFSPTTVTTAGGTEFEGAVWSFFHLLFTRKNKITALRLALYRQNLPNITNLMATLLIFLLCIYFQGWKVIQKRYGFVSGINLFIAAHINNREKEAADVIAGLEELSTDDTSDEGLFGPFPPRPDCPICFLPLPIDISQSMYQTCCGKMICNGCSCEHSRVLNVTNEKRSRKKQPPLEKTCPFCRAPQAALGNEIMMECIRKRMKVNDADAFRIMGRSYERGKSVSKDEGKAVEHYLRAFELGSAVAGVNLAICYINGLGVDQDHAKAREYARFAARQGISSAHYYLGLFAGKDGNFDLAVKHFRVAAAGGYAKSLDQIKQGFTRGWASKVDYAESLRAYQAARDEENSGERERAAAFYAVNAALQTGSALSRDTILYLQGK